MITSLDQLDLTKKYTYADYLTWQFDDMVELVKGFIYKMSPAPTSMHQRISKKITGELYNFLKNKKCEYFNAPFDVRLIKNKNKENGQIETIVQPDICIICDLEKIDELGCIGSPDLIIEIVSKSSKKWDYHDKYDLYEENGVLEYWIVDPDSKSVDVFVLEDEKYVQKGVFYNQNENIPCFLFPDFKINWNDIFTE
jgi:Uma2 family endonuclease